MTRVYLRIGKKSVGSCKVDASTKPNYQTLMHGREYLPTVLVALDLNIPDEEFDAARIKLDINITHTQPAVEVRQVQIE
jgi:hypothetical protein